MITNEINLFGLSRVEDECKTQTRFIEFVIIPSWHWTRTRTYFSLPLYFKVCKNQQIIWKHAMKLTLMTFIINVCRLAVSHNNMQTIVSVTSFRLLRNQVSRNIVLAPRSVMITISLLFNSQSDCSILSEVTRKHHLMPSAHQPMRWNGKVFASRCRILSRPLVCGVSKTSFTVGSSFWYTHICKTSKNRTLHTSWPKAHCWNQSSLNYLPSLGLVKILQIVRVKLT